MDLFYFQEFEKTFYFTIYFQQCPNKDDRLRTLYNISLLIAESGKLHIISEELILPAINEVINIVLHQPAYIIKKLPLRNNSAKQN